ncbi:MAG: DUF2207 domain-containing protein [Arachnia sp.]
MKVLRRFLFTLLIAVGCSVAAVAPAAAEDSAPITSYHVAVELTPEGEANVVIDMTMDFGEVSGRGPILVWPTHQEDGATPDEWYVFNYSNIEVTSPTGAADDTNIEYGDTTVSVRIGDPNQYNYSPQDYRISYTVTGFIVSDHPESGLDEFNWDVIGPGWTSRFSDVEVSVTGPADVSKSACFYGSSYDSQCTTAATGTTATFSVESLNPNEPMQVVAGFPAGTFGGVEQAKTTRVGPPSPFQLTPAIAGTTGALSIGAIAWLIAIARRHTRDDIYLGLTPGLTPSPGNDGFVGPAAEKAPVTVQFQPPQGATPGEIGTLTDTTADGEDISATIVDLAVRGFLRIQPMGNTNQLIQLPVPQDSTLLPHEATLLNGLFRRSSQVSTLELGSVQYSELQPDARSALYQAVVARKWFKRSPASAHAIPMALGAVSIALGVFAGIAAMAFGWSLIAIPFLVLGIGLIALSPRFRTRTAEGSAYLAQAKGFELYLRTAEADQIKFEEGVDIFSRYLPYAMIFGVADRWTRVFAQLGAEGRYQADLTWYPGMSLYNPHAFSSGLTDMSEQVSQAMSTAVAAGVSAATSGSSGGSGFSGGGGFGGGGGGSW